MATNSNFKHGEMAAIAVRVINDNPTLNQTEVAHLLADELKLPFGRGVAYYRWYILNGRCDVKVITPDPTATKGRKAGSKNTKVKAVKAKAVKAPKVPVVKPITDGPSALAALERARARRAAAEAAPVVTEAAAA